MEDTSITTRTSVTHRVSPAYSAKIYKQLVRRLTEDLNHGLANTCNDFNLEDKCVIHFLLEAGNYSYTSARTAAIIARREKKKQRTKARNEKVKTSFTPKTSEELTAIEQRRKEECKKRGNNGAKRNMHYEMTVVEEDIYPSDPDFLNADKKEIVEIGSRCLSMRMRTRATEARRLTSGA